ncbi:MAG: glycosyltransferase family 1 protein [Candidatus Roizmanbacteria bacterium]|nr:glycosyltransferase family 1 protein [Candidatus Roizmanbacteria bacterium]
MNIGIDISQVIYEGTGVGRFTKGLIETILQYDTTNKWTFFFSSFRGKINEELLNKIKGSSHRYIHLPFPPAFLSFIWNTLHIISIETFTGPLDVFICSDWTEPPSKCKKATIVHDFAYLRYPETVHKLILETQKKRMNWVKKESSFIITPSKATQKDVSHFFSIPLDKITPLYSGVEIEKPSKEFLSKVANKYNLTKPFILSVGKIEPRKNISRLIDAFVKLDNNNWDLVIVGPEGWDNKSGQKKHESVKFTGYVSETELHALYELSQFFVYPSLWEGFGYPVIEAMMHERAVAASNNSSLAELVENNGILFNPLSIEEISSALTKLMTDENTRSIFAHKGFEYAQQFTWKRYYDGLMSILCR